MPKSTAHKLTAADAEVDTIQTETERAAEVELLDFLDGLGPAGVSEVALYRLLPTGKQRFIVSGPPNLFSEAYVQQTYGGGDYMVRAKLNGRWYRSKNFSVEGPNLGASAAPNGHSNEAELERLRLQIAEQQIRMEAERAAALQRSHELQLALIQHPPASGGGQMSIADMVAAVKNLNDMGQQGQIDAAIERVFSLASKVQQLTGGGNQGGGNGESSWWDWAKPVVQEAGKQLLPRVLPFLGNAAPAQTPPVPAAQPLPASLPSVSPTGQTHMGTPEQTGPSQTTPPPSMNPELDAEAVYRAQKHEALTFALMMARGNRQPEIWADMAIEQIETSNNPVTARFVSEIMNAPNFDTWFKDLETIEPTVITQRPWFDIFYQCVRDTLKSQAEAPKDE